MKIKGIKNLKNWRNKKVLLRLDLNVPLELTKVKNDYKIKASFETINYLLKAKAKLIIISHLGRPNNQFDSNFSLKPVARHLKKLLGYDVVLYNNIEDILKHQWLDKQILMLENLRFFKEEESNSITFAKQLARLADVYVNDAFAVSHRQHVSVDKIKKYLPAYAGLLLENELLNLNKIFNPKKPLIVVMGGAKVSTKINLIKSLEKKADKILFGGALANTLMHSLGYEVGKSVYEDKVKKLIKPFIKKNKLIDKLVLPVDLLVKNRMGKIVVLKIDQVKKTDTIFDIGPETIIKYCQLLKIAKTIVWNGPLGKFEEKEFKHGTLTIAIMIAALSNQAFSLVGGGETLRALKMTKMSSYINWISTGGGAMLTYLGQEKMPGLEKIIN